GITNTATATGTPPTGSPVTDISDNANDTDGNTTNDPTELVIAADPGIALVKTLQSGGPTFAAVDDELTFRFTVTNTGNITLTDPVTISDPLITDAGGEIVCDPVPLAPGADLTCEGTYAVTQDDIDAGEVINSATADAGDLTTPPSTVTVPALQKPSLETVKRATSITVDGTVDTDLRATSFVVGAVVAYDYTVTNTGNTTLTDAITVSDNLIDAVSCPALPAGGLLPEGEIVCQATFVVTATDVQLASVTNIASATSGTVTSPLVAETVPADGEPALTTEKTLLSVANPDGSASDALSFDQVDDALTYGFTVTNAGTVAFARPVIVRDTRFADPITCFTPSDTDPDLRAGESVMCEATYLVTQDDLDAGDVVNEAFAETIFGSDDRIVVSDPAVQVTPAAADPAITIAKAATPATFTAEGQTLRYTLTLTNSGNQTLTSVVARDPLLPALSCAFDELIVGETQTCSADYRVTQADVDAGEVINTASASAVTPQGGGVTDNTTLTTAGPAADPGLVLTKTATPVPFGAAGTAVTYVMAVENTGNVTLTNVMVSDPITSPPFTCMIARLRVGETDDSCALSLTVTQDQFDAGEITNTASASATGPRGTSITDSDTITTPARDPEPGLEATKVASLNGSIAGSTVDFTLFVRNTGDVTLTPAGITDTMTRLDGSDAGLAPVSFALQSGDTDGDNRIDVGETFVYRATYVLTLEDVNAGGLRNTVTVDATTPAGATVSDVSDNGNDADGNATDDPTVVEIIQGPALDATKALAQGGAAEGDEVIFVVTVRNIGNVSVNDLVIADTMTRADGIPIAAETFTVAPVDPGVVDQPLAPNAQREWRVTYMLTQDDVDAGGLSNVVVASGTDPEGNAVSDLADNGDDSDGNTTDDPTRVAIVPEARLEVVKTAEPFADPDAVVRAGDVITYTITANNLGNVTLSALELTDTMTNLDGTVLTPDSLALTSGASETEIGPLSDNVYTLTYTLTQDDVDAGGISNTATAATTAPSGVPLVDVSDNGDDTDGNTVDDPTIIPIGQISSVIALKEASTPTRVGTNRFEVVFDMSVENTGNITQTNLDIRDDLAAFVAPATLVSVDGPRVSGFTTGGANTGYNGTGDTALVTAGTSLAPQETATIAITVVYDVTGGSPAQPNTLVVNSDDLVASAIGTAEVPAVDEPNIVATKSVTPETALLGGTVTYRLTFENVNDTAERGLTIVDDMPSGVLFTPGTARFNGEDTPQPRIAGRQLIWDDIAMAPNQTITITFDARVTGEAGELVNRAYMLGPDGDVISNVATATLRRRPEAVFECGDVIGKVFDDRNMNGYQDGVSDAFNAQPGNNPQITDQRFDGGKYSGPPPVIETPEYEPGLAGVRLSTVTGTLITTDEYGRFSVPCAELPADIGSNFTLKLDERTLPTGYRVTTENPRVIRLTPGTVAKLNFGAAIANVVDIDLIASAFGTGAQPTQALVAGVDQLVAYLQTEPSVLRLSYYMNGEGRDLARARLDTVEALVRDRWRGGGGYRLLIERTIRQMQ
ncbi:DUF7507 domain-containing protein, partial [Yoonia sp. 208BN28-4]|uniref:DUF7507 domain-containing protein n=1 Tax=Yoonia sp. 208BN28-4 TaxID=3126505 RepID=UPI00309C9E93